MPNKKIYNLASFTIGLFLGIFFANKLKIENHSLLIEYLKIFISLPAVILLIFLLFITKFSSAIDYFIRNAVIKYGGAEVRSQQVKNISSDEKYTSEKSEKDIIKLSKQDALAISEGINEIENTKKNQQQTINQLHDLIKKLASRSEFFEFKYLSKFLVPNTQLVLRDLITNPPITKDLLINKISVSKTIADPKCEQIAIYDALLTNGLIIENNSIITVSKKGYRFLKFIGLT